MVGLHHLLALALVSSLAVHPIPRGRAPRTRWVRMAIAPEATARSPIINTDTGANAARPILLFLPDIDLSDYAIRKQLAATPDALRSGFEVRWLTVPADDRTGLAGLVELISESIEDEYAASDRCTYIVGDSFGGALALAVANSRAKPPGGLRGLVLINPATGVELSNVPLLMPVLDSLTSLPPPLASLSYGALAAPLLPAALAGSMSLAGLAADPMALTDIALKYASALPLETLRFRLALLRSTAETVAAPKQLARLQLPVQVLASSADRLLPSADEARRLVRDLPNARLSLLSGSGHAPLLEAGLSLSDMVRRSNIIARQPAPRPDYVRAFEPPSPEALANASASLDTIRRLASPVFFSTTAEGRRVAGLSGLPPMPALGAPTTAPAEGTPRRPPVLFVGNHQLIGPDIALLVEAVYRETGALVRGLSHPSNFRPQPDEQGGPDGGRGDGNNAFTDFNARFGAVPVGPRALFKLLSRGEPTLLYPGGIREAFKSTKRGEAYKLFWPPAEGGGDFARMAARFNATIVPVAAIGADECFEMLLDQRDLLKLPYVGPRLAETATRTPVARAGEVFVPPFSLPAPWRFRRFYFLFGSPIESGAVDAGDPEACAALYLSVQAELERSLTYLLERRAFDPNEPLLICHKTNL